MRHSIFQRQTPIHHYKDSTFNLFYQIVYRAFMQNIGFAYGPIGKYDLQIPQNGINFALGTGSKMTLIILK